MKGVEMRLRPFEEKDFEVIKEWIPDERGHAMWCANRFQYPLDKNVFLAVLSDMAKKHGDSPYVVTLDDDVTVGFFCYSVNGETGDEYSHISISDGTIEASPAVYKNMLVIGTRASKIFGIELQ